MQHESDMVSDKMRRTVKALTCWQRAGYKPAQPLRAQSAGRAVQMAPAKASAQAVADAGQ